LFRAAPGALFKARRDARAPLVPIHPRLPLHTMGMDFLMLGQPMDLGGD